MYWCSKGGQVPIDIVEVVVCVGGWREGFPPVLVVSSGSVAHALVEVSHTVLNVLPRHHVKVDRQLDLTGILT